MNFDSTFIETNLDFSSAITTDRRDKIYMPDSDVRLEYQNLYDAYRINPNTVGFLNSEHSNYLKYLKEKGIFQSSHNYDNFKKVYFHSQFMNSSYTGCKGGIAILGRYYSSGHHYILWEDSPRNDLARLIYTTKENNSTLQFLKWESSLVKSLESFLGFLLFRNKHFMPFDDTKILITSIPNSDGNNRFQTFLNMISIKLIQSSDSRFRNSIFVDENFFKLERNIESNRHGNYNQRRSVLEGAFSANSKILNSIPPRRYKWKIIIIDDVLTTGAHLEECLRATKSKYFNLNYEVLGVFLAATQRPEFVDRTAITYGLPRVIEVFDR